LHELRSFRHPPLAVCQIAEAAMLILDFSETGWAASRKRFDAAFQQRLLAFDGAAAKHCPKSRADEFLQLIESPVFRDPGVVPSVLKLGAWCVAVGRLLEGIQGDAPRVLTSATNHLLDLGGLSVEPELWNLSEAELEHVHEFRISRPGVGSVTFHGTTDCRGLLPQLSELVIIGQGEVVVYPDGRCKPPVGEGLNKGSSVVLYGCMPKSQAQLAEPRAREKYRRRVAQMTEDKGAIFEDYDCDLGVWKFRVEHF